MYHWDPTRQKDFILSVLQHDFRTSTEGFSQLAEKMQPLEEEKCAATSVDAELAFCSVSVIGATVLGALQHIDAISASEPRALLLEEAGEHYSTSTPSPPPSHGRSYLRKLERALQHIVAISASEPRALLLEEAGEVFVVS
eukprot:gene16959-23235_t